MLLLSGCAYDYYPQVQKERVRLIKKEEKWRGENMQVAQYWQSSTHGSIIFFELLPIGDTGSPVGSSIILLNKR